MEFVEKTIGEIESLIKTGKTPPSKEEKYYNGSINWYTPGDLDKTKFLGRSSRTITNEAILDKKAVIFPKNTVLIGAIGDIGKLGITSEDSSSNQQITGIVTNDEVHYEYLYYWLKANKSLLKGRAKNAILPILNNENLRSIKIKFPKEIDDQKRIAKVLSQCEKLILKRKESIDLLDALLQSTFLEMFGDVLSNSKKFPTKDFIDIIKLKRGFDFPKSERVKGDFPLCASNGVIDYVKEFKVKGPGIITGRSGTIGKVTLLFENYWPLNTTLYSEEYVGNPVYLKFLLHYFKLERFVNGAGVPTLNRNLFSKSQIIDVPIISQNLFAEIATNVERVKNKYQTSLKEFENLYGSIGQRAFKGELDLTKVDISDMEDSKKKDMEEVEDELTEEQLNNLKKILDESKKNEGYLSEIAIQYIDKSKILSNKVKLMYQEGEIKIDNLKEDLERLNIVGGKLILEINEYAPSQIDQYKYIENYISFLPQNILDDYKNISLFSRNKFDYRSMTLDDFYGIPDEVIGEYGSIENHMFDLEFFLKQNFSDKAFTIEDVEELYNKVTYDRGGWFKYEEMKEQIFKYLEGDNALLAQSFEDILCFDNSLNKEIITKRIVLRVIK